jgi:hypothetical protein
MSPLESPKSVLAPIRALNTRKDRLVVLSAEARMVRGTGPNGPRPGARATPPLRMSGRSVPGAQMVRDGVEGLLRRRPRSRLMGGTRRGGDIVGRVLVSAGHPRCL